MQLKVRLTWTLQSLLQSVGVPPPLFPTILCSLHSAEWPYWDKGSPHIWLCYLHFVTYNEFDWVKMSCFVWQAWDLCAEVRKHLDLLNMCCLYKSTEDQAGSSLEDGNCINETYSQRSWLFLASLVGSVYNYLSSTMIHWSLGAFHRLHGSLNDVFLPASHESSSQRWTKDISQISHIPALTQTPVAMLSSMPVVVWYPGQRQRYQSYQRSRPKILWLLVASEKTHLSLRSF